MGNAKFFYYPQPDGRHLVEINMGEALGELQSVFTHDAVDAITQAGGIYRSVSRGAEFVTLATASSRDDTPAQSNKERHPEDERGAQGPGVRR